MPFGSVFRIRTIRLFSLRNFNSVQYIFTLCIVEHPLHFIRWFYIIYRGPESSASETKIFNYITETVKFAHAKGPFCEHAISMGRVDHIDY